MENAAIERAKVVGASCILVPVLTGYTEAVLTAEPYLIVFCALNYLFYTSNHPDADVQL